MHVDLENGTWRAKWRRIWSDLRRFGGGGDDFPSASCRIGENGDVSCVPLPFSRTLENWRFVVLLTPGGGAFGQAVWEHTEDFECEKYFFKDFLFRLWEWIFVLLVCLFTLFCFTQNYSSIIRGNYKMSLRVWCQSQVVHQVSDWIVFFQWNSNHNSLSLSLGLSSDTNEHDRPCLVWILSTATRSKHGLCSLYKSNTTKTTISLSRLFGHVYTSYLTFSFVPTLLVMCAHLHTHPNYFLTLFPLFLSLLFPLCSPYLRQTFVTPFKRASESNAIAVLECKSCCFQIGRSRMGTFNRKVRFFIQKYWLNS